MALGLWPPILRGATLPVSWNRRTQLITVLGATPNRAATRCRDSPPSKTAATARSRRSIDKGLAIHAGLLSSQHVESDPSRFGIDCAQSHPALKNYRITQVEGDKYGAEFVQEQFRLNAIRYVESEKTTSDYFAGLLPILTSGRTRLLDHKRLASQLCSLERRTSRVGAKDSIGHPPGGHDDLCANVAGLMVRLAAKRPMIISDKILQCAAAPRSAMQREFRSFEGRFIG